MLQTAYGSHLTNGWYWDKEYYNYLTNMVNEIGAEKSNILYGRLIKMTIRQASGSSNIPPPPFLVRRCENTKHIELAPYKDYDLSAFQEVLDTYLGGFTFVGYLIVDSTNEYNFDVQLTPASGTHFLFVDPNDVSADWELNRTNYYTLSNNNYIQVEENDNFNPYENYYVVNEQINVFQISTEENVLNTLYFQNND